MFRLGVGIATVVLALDRLSKWWLINALGVTVNDEIAFGDFFSLVLVWNRGVSFGMFNGSGEFGRWALTIVALGIVAVLAVWLYRAADRMIAVALGLVIGGAIGNIYDRLAFGAVADFLDLHYKGFHWPAFNIADSAISIGVVLMLWDALFRKKGT